MIETISTILEAAAKYAWGLFVVCLFVILLPDGPSEAMGLKTIKGDYLGFWWIGLIFSAAIWGGSLFSRISAWFSTTRYRSAVKAAIIKRLYTLDKREQMWIAYCLLHNVQSLGATTSNQTANSLLHKGIVTQGTGSILSIPFLIKDFVWEYLQARSEEFLPSEVRENHMIVRNLERFAAELKEPF